MCSPLLSFGRSNTFRAFLVISNGALAGLAISFDCNDHSMPWSEDQVLYCSPYDCRIKDGWDQAWSPQKKAWCCKHQGVACHEDSYDCTAGWASYEDNWAPPKRTWCCIHKHLGCTDGEDLMPMMTTNGQSSSHQLGAPLATAGVGPGVKVGKFRPSPVPHPQPTTPPQHMAQPPDTTLSSQEVPQLIKTSIAQQTIPPFYNCYSASSGWTFNQREWCCSKLHRGCETTSHPARFDCAIGESMWPAAQREWCCRELNRGCAPTTTQAFSEAGHASTIAAAPVTQTITPKLLNPKSPVSNIASGDSCHKVVNWDDYPDMRRTLCCTKHGIGCGAFSCKGVSYAGWSSEKRKYCCVNRGVGCTTSTTQVPIQSGNNCHDHLSTWETSWSSAKKHACCKEAGFGCDKYDCTSSLSDWHNQWKPEKQAWCCMHKYLGCLTAKASERVEGGHATAVSSLAPSPATPTTATAVTTTARFNCHDSGHAGESRWSQVKRDWCCLKQHVGCDPYNCTRGSRSSKSWMPAKIVWCCHNRGLGCPEQQSTTATITKQFDCAAGLLKWERGWSPAKKNWCCQHYQIACGRFDCHEGLGHGQSTWTQDKKTWCCTNAKLGCEAPESTPKRTTGTSTSTLDASTTSTPKLVTSTSTAQSSDSTTSLEWSRESSERRHDKNVAVSREDTALEPFGEGDDVEAHTSHDCSAGLARWESGWSRSKKKWCCDRMQVACAPYNCNEDVHDWRSLWNEKKQTWCCKSAGRGCAENKSPSRESTAKGGTFPGTHVSTKEKDAPYDCMSDVHDWSTDQKAWCCEKTGQGCASRARTTTSRSTATTTIVTTRIVTTTVMKVNSSTADVYDCFGAEISEDNHQYWVHNWPEDHKKWCCRNKGVGCHGSNVASVQAKFNRPLDGASGYPSAAPREVSTSSAGVLVGCCIACLLFVVAMGMVVGRRLREDYVPLELPSSLGSTSGATQHGAKPLLPEVVAGVAEDASEA